MTIEERAYEKALKMLKPNPPTTRELLVEIATEQRKIDINNAIAFLRQYGEGDFSCWEEFEYVFRKAMGG